jgi:hypothetical protein
MPTCSHRSRGSQRRLALFLSVSPRHYPSGLVDDLGAKIGRRGMELRLHLGGAHGMLRKMARHRAGAPDVRRNVAGFFRAGSGLSRSGWRVARAAGAIAAAALAIFHVSLFWSRIADGQLLDPMIAARWIGGGGLVAALVALRRRGVSLLGGRQALIVWLLVVLLHWSVTPRIDVGDPGQSTTTEVTFVLPSTAAAAFVGIGLLLATFAARRFHPALTFLCMVEPDATGSVLTGWTPAAAARAPPFRLV